MGGSIAEAEPAGVWPDNWPIVEAFLLASTQWRAQAVSGPAGGRMFWLGLDYSAARVAFDLGGVTLDAEQFAGLRIMEIAARDALNGAVE